jgi:DNA-binding transcriptional MocR family regulator
MKLQSTWLPRLAETTDPSFERLTAALVEDIAAGLIGPGDRLPAHRELAWHLKVGVGTVTKAYAALARRGLVRSVHGRGMFVAAISPAARPTIDLSINTPPHMLSDRLLSATLETLAHKLDAGMFSAYTPAAGRPEHRLQMARWLSEAGLDCRRENLLLTNGAQQALAIALAVAATRGAALFTEALTYPGALLIARRSGLKFGGIEMDEQGMTADALDKALTKDTSPRRVVYVTPTLHNPTTATMDVARRKDIVRVCRDHDAVIVEDDVYSAFAPPGHLSLATMAPERTFYVTGFSKTLSPGLRMGALVAPDWATGEAEACLMSGSTMAAPLSTAMMELWLSDGTA